MFRLWRQRRFLNKIIARNPEAMKVLGQVISEEIRNIIEYDRLYSKICGPHANVIRKLKGK
jgi:hypothetical protein